MRRHTFRSHQREGPPCSFCTACTRYHSRENTAEQETQGLVDGIALAFPIFFRKLCQSCKVIPLNWFRRHRNVICPGTSDSRIFLIDSEHTYPSLETTCRCICAKCLRYRIALPLKKKLTSFTWIQIRTKGDFCKNQTRLRYRKNRLPYRYCNRQYKYCLKRKDDFYIEWNVFDFWLICNSFKHYYAAAFLVVTPCSK